MTVADTPIGLDICKLNTTMYDLHSILFQVSHHNFPSVAAKKAQGSDEFHILSNFLRNFTFTQSKIDYRPPSIQKYFSFTGE